MSKVWVFQHVSVGLQRSLGCILLAAILVSFACNGRTGGEGLVESMNRPAGVAKTSEENIKMQTATLGAGCFWCVEAVFQQLVGVETVKSGYMGGAIENPTYQQVCTGLTGHAEVIQIQYDPEKITFDELLEVFWKTHDPTTLNRQGADEGTQYRSAVFYHTDQQKQIAESYKQRLNDAQAFPDPIITEITEASQFYPAEEDHQDFYSRNKNQPFCRVVIPPKLEKLKEVFGHKLKQK